MHSLPHHWIENRFAGSYTHYIDQPFNHLRMEFTPIGK
jgi:hypothetical protein